MGTVNFNISQSIGLNESFSINNYVWDSLTTPDNKILIWGRFTLVNGITKYKIARLNIDLTLDNTFNPQNYNYNSFDSILGVIIDNNGDYIIFSEMVTINGEKTIIYKISNTGVWISNIGTIQPTEGYNDSHKPYAALLGTTETPDYCLVRIDGNSNPNYFYYNGSATYYRYNVLNYNTGQIHREVNISIYGNNYLRGIKNPLNKAYINNDGSINQYVNIYKINKDVDELILSNFKSTDSNPGLKYLKIIDNKYYLCGHMTEYNGTQSRRFIIINSDGTVFKSFNINFTNANPSPTEDTITDFIVLDNGKYLLGGYFNINGTSKYNLMLLNNDGTLDTTFNINLSSLDPSVTRIIKLFNNNYLILAGDKSYTLTF